MNIDAPPAKDGAPDLYAVLGVERTATKGEIIQAYREKARVLHPDVAGTGDKAAFQQIRLARDILSNPKWRENYDKVGIIEEDQADNEQAFLLTALTGLFGQVMHSVLSQGGDPTSGDFVAAMLQAIKAGFDTTNGQIAQLESSLGELRKLDGRFSVKSLEQPNHMNTIVEGQIAMLEKQIEGNRTSLRQLETARVYLADVAFRKGSA
jgi:curved DNA-binding protein CbpA